MDFSLSWPDTLHLLSLNVAKSRPWHGVFGAADSLAMALTTVLFWFKKTKQNKNPQTASWVLQTRYQVSKMAALIWLVFLLTIATQSSTSMCIYKFFVHF